MLHIPGYASPNDRGLAAEYLVCADLAAKGFHPIMAPGGAKFDIMAFRRTGMPVRIQVKSTQDPIVKKFGRTPSEIEAGRKPGKREKLLYRFVVGDKYIGDEADLFAFVAFQERNPVMYAPFEVRNRLKDIGQRQFSERAVGSFEECFIKYL